LMTSLAWLDFIC